MAKKLTAKVILPENPDFNQKYGVLKLEAGQQFTAGIKEYQEEDAAIKAEINDLEARKDAVDRAFEEKKEAFYRQALERYERGGDWITTETYNAKSMTHAEVSMHENIKQAEKEAESLKAAIEEQLATLEQRADAIKSIYDEVCWAWVLAKKRSRKPTGRNESLAKGSRQVTLSMSPHLWGGGLAWLEPFFDGERPTGSTKNGFYVQCKAGTAEIITGEWYGYDASGKDMKIEEPVSVNTKVALHLYTKDMYGHNIRIELKANGKTLKANAYGHSITLTATAEDGDGGTDDVESESEYGVIESEDLFLTEVDIYDYSDPDSVQPPPGVVTGHLVNSDEDHPDGKITLLPNVQKAILELYIDPEWCRGKSKLIIKPTIHFSGQKVDLDIPLEVRTATLPTFQMPDSGNQVVFVDNVETDFEAFHSCGYSKFELFDGKRTLDLFEDKSIPPLNLFELVAGPRNNTHDIEIRLDTETVDCYYEDTPRLHHKGKVISIVEYPEESAEEELQSDKKSSSAFNSVFKMQLGGDKTHLNQEAELGLGQKLEIYSPHDDTKLKFKARFIYDYSSVVPGTDAVHPIFRYLWLGQGVSTNKYIVQAQTCRYQHQVNIVTYPDVAWSLKLSYSNSKVEKELISNQRYTDTKKAKFKREPQTWLPVGDKYVGISLGATWDKNGKFDATANISRQIRGLLDKFGVIGSFIERVFLGKENKKDESYQEPDSKHREALEKVQEDKKNKELSETRAHFESAKRRLRNATTDKERRDAERQVNLLQRKLDKQAKKFDLKLTRSVVGIEIQFPEIEAEFNWSREIIDQHGPFYNQTGVVLEGALELKPLIGLKAYLDFLALAQRAHPLALAIIAAIDIGMELIGDGSKIVCELSAKGTFGGKIQGFLNTKTKENSFNKEDRNANGKELAELKCDLEFKLQVGIELNIEKRTFFVRVVLTGKLGAEATAKWRGRALIDADDEGWFLAPEVTFEGIEIKAEASLSGQATSRDGKSKYGSVETNNEFKWQAIDPWKEPKKWGPWHFVKSNA